MKDHRPVVDGYPGRSTRPGQAIAGTEVAVSSVRGCTPASRKTPSAVAFPQRGNAGRPNPVARKCNAN